MSRAPTLPLPIEASVNGSASHCQGSSLDSGGACAAARCRSAQLRTGPRHRNSSAGSGELHWDAKGNNQYQGPQLPWTPRPVSLLGQPESSLSVPISSGPTFRWSVRAGPSTCRGITLRPRPGLTGFTLMPLRVWRMPGRRGGKSSATYSTCSLHVQQLLRDPALLPSESPSASGKRTAGNPRTATDITRSQTP